MWYAFCIRSASYMFVAVFYMLIDVQAFVCLFSYYFSLMYVCLSQLSIRLHVYVSPFFFKLKHPRPCHVKIG